MRVRWLRHALANLNAISAFVAKDNPDAARALAEHIEDTVALLSLHPSLGRAGRVTGTRELVIPGTKFIVTYRVKGGEVQVLRVMHGAQRWPDAL